LDTEHSAARASWELAFFDDDFVVKVSVHEMSPHAVPVLDSRGAFGASPVLSLSSMLIVGNFFLLFFFFFDVSFSLPALPFFLLSVILCSVTCLQEWMYRMWSGKYFLALLPRAWARDLSSLLHGEFCLHLALRHSG
jgi:hypothetical protein